MVQPESRCAPPSCTSIAGPSRSRRSISRRPGRVRSRCVCTRAGCAEATGAPSRATRRARSRPFSATKGRAWSSGSAPASTRSSRGTTSCSRGFPYCGRCPHCTSGRLTLCDVAAPALLAGTLLDGTTRLSLDGRPVHHYSFLSTFADRTVVPEASCVRIRRDAPLRVAALVGCAIATGFGAVVNRAQLAPGSSLAVFGVGGVGLSAVQAGVLSGAGTVVAVDPAPARRAVALDLVLRTRSTPATATPWRPCVSSPADGGADCAVESSGARRRGRRCVPVDSPGRHSGVRRAPTGRRVGRVPGARNSSATRRPSWAASTARAGPTPTCRC